MTIDPSTAEFIRWLIQQGIGVAIALLVLFRLDRRMSKIEELLATLIGQHNPGARQEAGQVSSSAV